VQKREDHLDDKHYPPKDSRLHKRAYEYHDANKGSNTQKVTEVNSRKTESPFVQSLSHN